MKAKKFKAFLRAMVAQELGATYEDRPDVEILRALTLAVGELRKKNQGRQQHSQSVEGAVDLHSYSEGEFDYAAALSDRVAQEAVEGRRAKGLLEEVTTAMSEALASDYPKGVRPVLVPNGDIKLMLGLDTSIGTIGKSTVTLGKGKVDIFYARSGAKLLQTAGYEQARDWLLATFSGPQKGRPSAKTWLTTEGNPWFDASTLGRVIT